MQARDVKKGSTVLYQNECHLVTEMSHRTPGNKRAFFQITLKNLKNGRIVQNRFAPDEPLERVALDPKQCQFLYKDDQGYHFMDMENYHSFMLTEESLGDKKYYLKESMEIKIDFHEEKPVFPEVPGIVTLKVTDAPPGVRGDSVSNTLKVAVCETGLKLSVPLFIDKGTEIKVNTETGEYVGRA
ncbi:MAG: elongation factor P [Candidatus Omnitrophota bacterium]